jgi:hypothetical protein
MLTLYKSNIDEFNPEANGGEITDEVIESGVIENVIPNVRPFTAESGGERWFKFFIKAEVDLITIGIDIARVTDSESEEVFLALGGESDVESELDKENIRVYGGFVVESVDLDNIKVIADRDVSEFVKVDDLVTFYDSDINRIVALKVKEVNENEITFESFGDKEIKAGFSGSSTLFIDKLNAGEAKGIWIKNIIAPFTKAMEEPPNSFILNVWYDVK